MKLTKEMEREYLESGGGRCPYCKSTNLNTDGFEEGSASERVSCVNCDMEWVDCYQLVGITELDQ
ncbi:hypothetical protein LCGC14_1227060 [marine sediment metagenome]|uniref:Uncharacterized protein n=1 Tax=marine sediment metagenome TaxID=412755 RepID=A0A0F9L9J8_9ZZZZ